MPSFRLLNQAPQYLLADGSVNAGGSLTFYEADLITLKNTWSDEALTTLNSNPVELDAAGRSETDIWLDGEYGVVLKTALGATVWTRENVRASTEQDEPLPALGEGEVWMGDGAGGVEATTIRQVADPTGHPGGVYRTDGETEYWDEMPEAPTLDVVVQVSPLQLRVGDGDDETKVMILAGTETAPASNSPQTSKAVLFDEAFSTVPVVNLTCTSNSQPGGPVVAYTTSVSLTGFTAEFDVAEGDPADQDVINPIPFAWQAVGTKEVSA